MQDLSVPVIAIDGGAGTGKGTARHNVAKFLGFHELDSGMLYRAVGWRCDSYGIGPTNIAGIVNQAKHLDIQMDCERVILWGSDCTEALRSEEVGELAKKVAKIPEVRQAIMAFQLSKRRAPGLVADGRDMGDIFQGSLKFFLKARLEVVAERRVAQLRRLNKPANFDEVLRGIRERDLEDKTRPIAPLRPHPEARVIDTSETEPETVRDLILDRFRENNERFGLPSL